MDGWRGTRLAGTGGLGYPGGRTGWFGNFANNDALRGIGGLGSNHENANQSAANNSHNYGAARKQQQATTLMLTAVGMIGSLYLLAEYRGRNKLLKAIKKTTSSVNREVKRGIDRVTGNN